MRTRRRRQDTSDVPALARDRRRPSPFRFLPLVNTVLIVLLCGQFLYGAITERSESVRADEMRQAAVLKIVDGRTAERKRNEAKQQREIDAVAKQAAASQAALNQAVCDYLPDLPDTPKRAALAQKLGCRV